MTPHSLVLAYQSLAKHMFGNCITIYLELYAHLKECYDYYLELNREFLEDPNSTEEHMNEFCIYLDCCLKYCHDSYVYEGHGHKNENIFYYYLYPSVPKPQPRTVIINFLNEQRRIHDSKQNEP